MKGKEIILTCSDCKRPYDLGEADLVARQNGTREIRCPHCGVKVGTSN